MRIQVRFFAWQQCSMMCYVCIMNAVLWQMLIFLLSKMFNWSTLHQTLEIKSSLIMTQTRHFMHPSDHGTLTSSLMHITQRGNTLSPSQWQCDLSVEEHLSPTLSDTDFLVWIEPLRPTSFEVGAPIIFVFQLYTWINYKEWTLGYCTGDNTMVNSLSSSLGGI